MLKLLESKYKVYVRQDAYNGVELISENYVDIFVIMSDNHIETETWEFINELHKNRMKITPIVFVSHTLSDDLESHRHRYGWFFHLYPIRHEDFL